MTKKDGVKLIAKWVSQDINERGRLYILRWNDSPRAFIINATDTNARYDVRTKGDTFSFYISYDHSYVSNRDYAFSSMGALRKKAIELIAKTAVTENIIRFARAENILIPARRLKKHKVMSLSSGQLVAWQRTSKAERGNLYVLNYHRSEIRVLEHDKTYDMVFFNNHPALAYRGYNGSEGNNVRISLNDNYVYQDKHDYIFASMKDLRKKAKEIIDADLFIVEHVIDFAIENGIEVSKDKLLEFYDKQIKREEESIQESEAKIGSAQANILCLLLEKIRVKNRN